MPHLLRPIIAQDGLGHPFCGEKTSIWGRTRGDVMETCKIPEEHWLSFFDTFSRDYFGWPCTLEVLDERNGPQHLAENLPLQGISFDTKGTRACSIEISAGDQPGRH